ncbi:MAG: ABC transporter [Propionibacteriaceae bacterium]|nr:ABC transporter [Propionibacteriaceae bacterium]
MTAGEQPLAAALRRLDALLPEAQYPLPLDEADGMRRTAAAVANQVRDHLLPRAMRLDAPLLVVVGGSTGSGKSTLVNSLIRARLTRPGVLRPTTTSPVLVAHPDDLAWFDSGNVLPNLVRSSTPVHDSRALHVVAHDALPPGLALLDAPDIDSIDDANRRLSRQLLAAADLWVFVTSAARYADAVGWELLEQAAARDAVVSVVLNRCPPESVVDLRSHLAEMLSQRGLPAARLFAVAERHLDAEGMLPLEDVQPIRAWLAGLAAESGARADVALQTLAGAVRGLDVQLQQLADGMRRQNDAVEELSRQAANQFRLAADEVALATSDGTMLRGEVLSRWQDFVGTGEFMRGVEEQISRFRDRITGWFTGRQEAEGVRGAINDGLAALIVEHGQAACESAVNQWMITSWGREIIDINPGLAHTTKDFDAEATRAVREWQADVLRLVEEQGRGKRTKARVLALGTNAVGAALIIVVFATTGGLTTAEVGIAGGTSLLAQRLLEGVFGEDAVRRLAQRAKGDLDARVQALFATQLSRFFHITEQLEVDTTVAERLDAVAAELRLAGSEAFNDLTRPEGF